MGRIVFLFCVVGLTLYIGPKTATTKTGGNRGSPETAAIRPDRRTRRFEGPPNCISCEPKLWGEGRTRRVPALSRARRCSPDFLLATIQNYEIDADSCV